MIIGQAAASSATLADVAAAFESTNTTPTPLPGFGPVPRNVAYICTYTWMCIRATSTPTAPGMR